MKHQQLRKLLLLLSLLLFPITIYYFSPALIIMAGFEGIINGSFIVFLCMFLVSVFFGRLFCSHLCPSGGLQECFFSVNSKIPKQGWRNKIKYIIWIVWVGIIIFVFCFKGEILKLDFLYQTEYGISIANVYSYIIYYGILVLILIPIIFGGKRAFCHYFCWMAPFMVLGTKVSKLLHLPNLHIHKKSQDCISCMQCNNICPMGIKIEQEIKNNADIFNSECIQCGACVDTCPKKVLTYTMKRGKQ